MHHPHPKRESWNEHVQNLNSSSEFRYLNPEYRGELANEMTPGRGRAASEYFYPPSKQESKRSLKLYRFEEEEREFGTVLHYRVQRRKNVYMSWREVIDMWRKDENFCLEFSQILEKAPYEAFFWETVSCNAVTLENDFEMVLVDSKQLAATSASYRHFNEHFQCLKHHESVVSFSNLGGDALLVAPCPLWKPRSMYAHLHAFVRDAPDDQVIDFWRTLGSKLELELEKSRLKPIWVSTSGLGVPWLHARIDFYPKYYQYKPFKRPPVKQQEPEEPDAMKWGWGCFPLRCFRQRGQDQSESRQHLQIDIERSTQKSLHLAPHGGSR